MSFPIGLLGIDKSRYPADVVGDSAAKCPGLVPLISLLTQGCLISCGYFSNLDGLLGIRTTSGFCAQRLLLTDSGHYLMPITNFHQRRDRGWDRLIHSDFQQVTRAAKRQELHHDRRQQANFVSGLVSSYLADDDPDHDHLGTSLFQ